FASKKAMGEDGYLPERGLIPLSNKELLQVRKSIKSLKVLKM
ncbi:MAG TPA: phosphate ABC transporter substrate-binding protein, partial [Gammaproteobacteria bacterium]|nr:phosphate ABC transporter substrate-binding protein [Gammaproteobacteria bacterium]